MRLGAFPELGAIRGIRTSEATAGAQGSQHMSTTAGATLGAQVSRTTREIGAIQGTSTPGMAIIQGTGMGEVTGRRRLSRESSGAELPREWASFK